MCNLRSVRMRGDYPSPPPLPPGSLGPQFPSSHSSPGPHFPRVPPHLRWERGSVVNHADFLSATRGLDSSGLPLRGKHHAVFGVALFVAADRTGSASRGSRYGWNRATGAQGFLRWASFRLQARMVGGSTNPYFVPIICAASYPPSTPCAYRPPCFKRPCFLHLQPYSILSSLDPRDALLSPPCRRPPGDTEPVVLLRRPAGSVAAAVKACYALPAAPER